MYENRCSFILFCPKKKITTIFFSKMLNNKLATNKMNFFSFKIVNRIFNYFLVRKTKMKVIFKKIFAKTKLENVHLFFESARFSIRPLDQMSNSSWKSNPRAFHKTRTSRFCLLFFSFFSKLFCWCKLPHQFQHRQKVNNFFRNRIHSGRLFQCAIRARTLYLFVE
jgi:hypothetical protein